MSNHQCVTHPPQSFFVAVREDYVGVCKKQEMSHPLCAAAILNLFEGWANNKLAKFEQELEKRRDAKRHSKDYQIERDIWIWMPQRKIKELFMGLFGDTHINRSLKDLEAAGFIKSRRNPKNGWDKSLQYLFFPRRCQKAIHKWARSDDAPERTRRASNAQNYGSDTLNLSIRGRKGKQSNAQNYGSNTLDSSLDSPQEIESEIKSIESFYRYRYLLPKLLEALLATPDDDSDLIFQQQLAIWKVSKIGNTVTDDVEKIRKANTQWGAEAVLAKLKHCAEAKPGGIQDWNYVLKSLERDNPDPSPTPKDYAHYATNGNTPDTPLPAPEPSPPAVAEKPPVPVSSRIDDEHMALKLKTPREVWETTLNQLEIQLDRASFDTWLRDAVLVDFEATTGTFTLVARNAFARDNCNHRFNRMIGRILCAVAGIAVSFEFKTEDELLEATPA